jgi:hypothetical protein
MVEEVLIEDSLGRITYDEGKSLLKLEWLGATKDMISPHFQYKNLNSMGMLRLLLLSRQLTKMSTKYHFCYF